MTILEMLQNFPSITFWEEKDVNFDSLPNPSTDQEFVCQGEMTALQKSLWVLVQHFIEEATEACVALEKHKTISDDFWKLSAVRETAVQNVVVSRSLLREDIRQVFGRQDSQDIRIIAGWQVFYLKSKKQSDVLLSFGT